MNLNRNLDETTTRDEVAEHLHEVMVTLAVLGLRAKEMDATIAGALSDLAEEVALLKQRSDQRGFDALCAAVDGK